MNNSNKACLETLCIGLWDAYFGKTTFPNMFCSEVKHKAWFTHLMYVFTSTFSCNSAKKASRHGLTLNKTSLLDIMWSSLSHYLYFTLSIRLYCEFNIIMFPRCAQVTSKWPLHHIFSRFTNLIAASCSAIAHSLYHLEFVALWSVSSVHVVS